MWVRRDDQVCVTYEGRSVSAVVIVASPNGRSLMLGWTTADMLGRYVGMMPILLHDDGVYRDLIDSKPVTLEPILG